MQPAPAFAGACSDGSPSQQHADTNGVDFFFFFFFWDGGHGQAKAGSWHFGAEGIVIAGHNLWHKHVVHPYLVAGFSWKVGPFFRRRQAVLAASLSGSG